jgi:hypothetical protein
VEYLAIVGVPEESERCGFLACGPVLAGDPDEGRVPVMENNTLPSIRPSDHFTTAPPLRLLPSAAPSPKPTEGEIAWRKASSWGETWTYRQALSVRARYKPG